MRRFLSHPFLLFFLSFPLDLRLDYRSGTLLPGLGARSFLTRDFYIGRRGFLESSDWGAAGAFLLGLVNLGPVVFGSVDQVLGLFSMSLVLVPCVGVVVVLLGSVLIGFDFARPGLVGVRLARLSGSDWIPPSCLRFPCSAVVVFEYFVSPHPTPVLVRGVRGPGLVYDNAGAIRLGAREVEFVGGLIAYDSEVLS